MDENRSLHSLGVAKKMVEIGKNKGLSTEELNDLFTLGIVHDVFSEIDVKKRNNIIKVL